MKLIEEFSTNDLLDELIGRHDHAIFCGLRIDCEQSNQYLKQYVGNFATVLGLCRITEDYITEQMREAQEEK